MANYLEKEDLVISDFLKSIGPWWNHVAISGGYAPIIYKLYFDKRKTGNPPVGTRDLDSLVPRRVPAASKKDIAQHLKDAGFKHVFRDSEQPATEAYVKEIDGNEVEIEFLTDDSTRGDKEKNVTIAGVVAQPLSYLKLSLKRTMKFQTKAGDSGKVVSPGAWIFHKGLTFTRRKAESKKLKDLYGIWYVATQLGKFSDSAIKEVAKIGKEHLSWLKTFRGNLQNFVTNASPAAWAKLEAQDPFGGLKCAAFEKLVASFWGGSH